MFKLSKGLYALIGLGLLGAAAAPAVSRQMRRINLEGKVVLITGGSRGLGLELARQFAKQGSNLVLFARDSAELARAKEQIGLPDDRLYTCVCDVTDEKQVKDSIAAVLEICGDIDILINNAGLIEAGAMEVQTNADYEMSMKTHFWGPLYTIQAVLPSMKRRKAGRIVNISSIAGLVSVPHLLPYSTSKHALVGFSEGLRAELLKDNIFVTTVCPGLMRTGSPVNADFKGQNEVEYALFSILDALPLTSIDATDAAKQIVEACRGGDATLIISAQAQILKALHSLAPDVVIDLMGLTNFILPAGGGIGTDKAKGRDSQSKFSPSLLTRLSDEAAKRNNENTPEQETKDDKEV